MLKLIRMLKPEITPYKRSVVFLFILAFLLSGTAPSIAKLFKEVFDGVFALKSSPTVALLVPLVYVLRGVLRYILAVQMRFIAEAVTARLRVRLMDHLLHLNLSFHGASENGSGGLMSRILNDMNVLKEGLFYLFELIVEPIAAIVIIIAMLVNDWRLTLFCLATAPLFIFVLRKTSRSLKKYGHRSQGDLEKITETLKESLDGIRVIQSFNLQSYQNKRFSAQTEDFLKLRLKILQRESAASPINEVLASVLIAALIYFQHGSIAEAQSTSGAFLAFMALAGFLQEPIKKMQEAFVRIQQSIVVCERVEHILDSEQIIKQSDNPVRFPENWQEIEFRNIGFSYGGEPILKSVNLKVKKGQQVALVGTSGSGKSTLVNLLPRFFDPNEGDILIDGVSIRQMDLADLRQHIALVTQDVFLFNDTVENNIRTGNLLRPREVEPSAQKAHAHDFLVRAPNAYQSLMGDRGGRFSGGEKQRVSIARAIYKDAPILILDEATSALDSVSELEVQKGLNSLMENRTTFVIAHRLSTVRQADLILVMKQGEIVEKGSHSDLMQAMGEYAQLYKTQLAE